MPHDRGRRTGGPVPVGRRDASRHQSCKGVNGRVDRPGGVRLQGIPRQGKAIIGMKIFGEGSLGEREDACMQFAQENSLLDAMTIGFHTPAQIDDALRLMHRYPAKPLV